MTRIDDMRLMTKVAHLYYERDLSQQEIAARLRLSQSNVSRLLKRALQEKIVRITVSTSQSIYTELEDALESMYGLQEAIIVESSDDENDLLSALGAAAAYWLETTLTPGEIIGISSWSSALLAMVNAMNPFPRASGAQVVQILGGVGNPSAEVHALQLTRRLSSLVQGESVFLTAPGVASSPQARTAFLQEPFVHSTMALFDQISLVLVGIGSIEPSSLLASSGNVFSLDELQMLRDQGAVGDICLHFFDAYGALVETLLNERVISISVEQLRRVKRAVGVAGGVRKRAAIRGALLGHWINVLITDYQMAQWLVENRPGDEALRATISSTPS
jgi:DNA-binding transcriptional regulator LsrR (DeoR family)